MAKKKDPSITFLNRFGYNVVKLPRVGIEPMDVIGKDQTTQWLGPLNTVWKSEVPLPMPSGPNAATNVNGQKTDKLNLDFGLKILANALAAFGASVPSLDFAYTKASGVQFSYGNVTSTSVPPFAAGDFLTKGGLNSSNPVVKHYFLDPGSQAFLIVDVLKSDTITVTATDEHGASVSLDVPAIQQIVGANVTVSADSASTGTLTYSGQVPVTFGFAANEIEYDGTSWSIHGAVADGGTSFGVTGGAAVQTAPTPVLLTSKCLLEMS